MKKFLVTLSLVAGMLAGTSPPTLAADWSTPTGDDGSGFVRGPQYKTHSLRWSTKLSDLPSGIYPMSPILAVGGKVFVNGAATDSVVALDAKTGEVVWRFAPDPRSSGSIGGYPNPQEPWIENGILYTSSTNGFLYALDIKTGRKVWSFQVTGTEYNKPIAKVEVCDGRVFMDVLGGIPDKGQHNVFALDAKTGRKLWSTYAGSPGFPGNGIWPDLPTDPSNAQKLGQARSTRRFEARPGISCAGNRVYFNAEDGVLRALEASTGKQVGAYDVTHHGDIGGQVDGAAGMRDPKTGHLIRNYLSNRMVRIDPVALETACAGQRSGLATGLCTDEQNEQLKVHPTWRNIYGSCEPGNGNTCGTLSDPTRSTVIGNYVSRRNDGIIGGAVFSSGAAIADRPDGKRVLYSPNQDGYLYAINFDNPAGGPMWRAPMGSIPKSLRDGTDSLRPGGVDLYTSNQTSNCASGPNCQNGPWEHRASNVSGPAIAGGVVYNAGSFDHAMYGFDWMTGAQVFRFEIKWDDKSQYPPFGDTKPVRFLDLDELIMTTPAHDGANLYFAANNGVVYAFSTQETIAKPRRNLAILGSGVVPFIPKWKEALGAFDYVWTPQGDWYKPSYTSTNSITAAQSAPGFIDAEPPLGYKGAQQNLPWNLGIVTVMFLFLIFVSQRLSGTVAPISLSEPLLMGRRETLVESLDEAEKVRKRHGI